MEEKQDLERNGTKTVELNNSPKALDGGWGWMTVLGTALCQIIFGIVMRAFGVTYMELLDRFKGSATATAWIGAINMTLAGLLAPFVSSLCDRYSNRTVCFIGGVMIAMGWIGTAFAPNLLTVYFTFGIIAGTGMSFCYVPGFIVIGEYFDKRKGIAMSVAMCASGIGAMFPPVMLYLFDNYGFEGAILILASISLNCCVGAALYRPLRANYTMPSNEAKICNRTESNEIKTNCNEIPDVQANSETCKEESLRLNGNETLNPGKDSCEISVGFSHKKEIIIMKSSPKNNQIESKCSVYKKPPIKKKVIDLSLFKQVRFLSLCYAVFSASANVATVTAFVPILARERGLSASKAVSLLSVSGVTSTIGSIVFGFIADFKLIRPKRVYFYSFLLFLIGVSAILTPLANKYVDFVMYTSLRSVSAGYFMAQRATITSDIVKKIQLYSAVGMVLFSTALGFLFGRVIGGVIRDTTGMYDLAFYVNGILCLSATIFLFYTEYKHSKRVNTMLQEVQ